MPKYMCTNYGSCPAAGKVVELPPGAELKCEEDGYELQEVNEASSLGRPKMAAAAVAAILVVAVGGWYWYENNQKSGTPSSDVRSLSVATPANLNKGATSAPESAAQPAPASPGATGMPPDEKALAMKKEEVDKKIVDSGGAGAAPAQKSVIAAEYVKAAMPLMQAGKWDDANAQLLKAQSENPEEPLIYYNQAIIHLKQRRDKDALAALELAMQKGFKDFQAMEGDADLKPLTSKPEYVALVSKYKTK